MIVRTFTGMTMAHLKFNALQSVISEMVCFATLSTAIAEVISGPLTYNGHAYYLLNQSTWTDAENQSIALGGHLVTIGDAAENSWIFSTFATFGGAQRLLAIGLRDAGGTGNFGWSSGAPVSFTNFAPGEPNFLGSERFAYMLPPQVSGNAYWNNDYDRSSSTYNGLGGNYGPFPVNGVAEVIPAPLPAVSWGGIVLFGSVGLIQTARRRKFPIFFVPMRVAMALAAWVLLTTLPLAAETIYATAFGNSTVSKISPDGSVSTYASGLNGVNSPEGLALDSSGSLYVANWGNSTILKIAAGGSISTFATGMSNPHDMDFDSSGNLYVATDLNGGTISKITPNGATSTFKTGLNFPHSLAFDHSDNLYFATEGSTTISKITPGGAISTFASGMSQPGGLVFDSFNNLYVLNHGDNTIKKVTAGGNVSAFTTALSGLGDKALTIDSSNNLYFNLNGTVSKLTPFGDLSTVAIVTSNYWDLVVAPPSPAPLPSTAWGGIALLSGIVLKRAIGRRKTVIA